MNTNDLIKKWDKNFKKLAKVDTLAKEQGKLVGRYIKEGVADGFAFYKVVKEGKRTVKIKHIKGLGDDYMISYWGEQATIDKDYAIKSVDFRDTLDNINPYKKGK